MGWYDDEEQGARLPQWALTPLMWLGCLAVAIAPSAMIVGLVQLVLHDRPAPVVFGAYLVSAVLMVAAVKPWTIR
ncbi:hypothetical protein [Caulobacter sp. FWC2]|uniref:hypothetical protein n=1 Tax=Caulobacter sp. FWC2 TaxID=69664 RepID=UPI000C14DE4E|nr:hypothetical protein [Caulobacter sp. FWC2]PIB92723.1 hypothetical protein CSW62_14815 [Caulobacter sp. FWC2]